MIFMAVNFENINPIRKYIILFMYSYLQATQTFIYPYTHHLKDEG